MRRDLPRLLVTGKRRNRHFLLKAQGVPVLLSSQLFEAFCELAAARLALSSPAVRLSRVIVFRLRQALDRAAGRDGFGAQLIWPASKGRYVLAVPAQQIALDPSFHDVLLTRSIDPAVAERLLAVASAQTDPKPIETK